MSLAPTKRFPIAEFDEKLQDILDGAEKLYYRLGVYPDLDNTIIRQIAADARAESQADSSAAHDHRSGHDRSRDARAQDCGRDRTDADAPPTLPPKRTSKR